MEWPAIKAEAGIFFKKYRFVILVLLAGLCLMMIPQGGEEPEEISIPAPQESTEQKLKEILGKIKGAGKVEVMLSEYRGRETVYQTDGQQSADSIREDTVIVSGSDREEAGLVRQTNPPIYMGALVVCQGGDIPGVKLAIVEAVMDTTGLSSDRITVLKMK